MRSCLISSLALLCVSLGSFAQTPTKVGVISIQGAIISTKDGQKASQEWETKFGPKKKEFQTRESELGQLQDQLNKGGSVMAEDKRSQLAREIDEKKKRLDRDMQDAQEDFQGEQQKLFAAVGQRMIAVIEKYAKDNGYSMILDVSPQNTPVLYVATGVDITQEIVALYDKTTANGAPLTTAAPKTATPAPKAPGTAR